MNTVRSIACLGALCGAVDIQGGDLWPEKMGERDLNLYAELPLTDQEPVGAGKFPVLYKFTRDCHTMTAMDYMLGNSGYPIRALILAGGNPANTNPNSEKVARAFSSLDLLVVRELFMSETARLAHYVLPAASFLERSELHFYDHYQWISLTKKILEIPGVTDEYSFWHDLAHRLGFGEKHFPWKTETEVNRWLLEPTGITLEKLTEHPEGLCYKPVRHRKFLEQPFPTPSGKFEFTSDYLKSLGFSALPEYIEPLYLRRSSAAFPLILITGARKIPYLHSRFRNIPRLHRRHPRAEVEIHPEDARKLDIHSNDQVRIVSEIGSIIVPARIVQATEIRAGVIQVTHGWVKEHNINRITYDLVNDPLSGFPQITSVPVRVERIEPS
ncbi:MAG: molybdopterin dinucleotide binding domain-containing protein [Spirochaetota bacterium]